GDHRDGQRLRQLHRGVDVDAGEHAVPADVGVDDGLDAPVLELLGEVDDLVAGQLAPAVGGHLAVLRIEPDDDVAAEGGAGVLEEARVLGRGGADDHVAQPAVDVLLDRVQVTDAAPQLHGDVVADRPQDGTHGGVVLRLAGEGAVQVHQVETPGAAFQPGPRHGGGVLAERGGLVHVALLEAYAVAVFQVDRGNQEHGKVLQATGGSFGTASWAVRDSSAGS